MDFAVTKLQLSVSIYYMGMKRLIKGGDALERDIGVLYKRYVWYLLCPMITILLIVFDWSAVLHIYEGVLLLISLCCIASEIYYKGTWWDSECIELQDEVRRKEKEKRKGFYVRPFFVGLPATLVVLVLWLPEIITYVKMAL